MVKPTQEVVESCVVVVGYGMVPRPSDCGTPVYVPFQESAGYKLEHSRRDAQALACRASLPRKRCCSPLPRTWCQPWRTSRRRLKSRASMPSFAALSPRPADRGRQLMVSSRRQLVTAKVNPAQEIDESASDVVFRHGVPTPFLYPRPADCGMPLMTRPSWCWQGVHSRRFPQGRHGTSDDFPDQLSEFMLLAA